MLSEVTTSLEKVWNQKSNEKADEISDFEADYVVCSPPSQNKLKNYKSNVPSPKTGQKSIIPANKNSLSSYKHEEPEITETNDCDDDLAANRSKSLYLANALKNKSDNTANASTAIITMRQEKQKVLENYDHYLR